MSDVHLGASYSEFGELAASRATHVLEAFRSLPEISTEERVDAALIAGDLFDGPQPPREAMAAVRETLQKFVDLCIPVFMVPGTHDAMTLRLDPYRELARGSRVVVQSGPEDPRREWPLKDETGQRLAAKHMAYVLASPRFGTPVTVETESGALHVYGVAYDVVECADPVSTFRRSREPGVHVALLHASVEDAANRTPSGSRLVTTPEALGGLEVDYVALGGAHRPRFHDDFPGVPACYPGCFAAVDLAEDGPRGPLLVELAPGAPPRTEHRQSGVRPVATLQVEVDPFPDEAAVAEAAANRLAEPSIPVVRLVGEPEFPLDGDAVESDLRERFGHAAVHDETRYLASARLDELAARDTVAGHVVRLARARIEASAEAEEREIARQALRVALRCLEVD